MNSPKDEPQTNIFVFGETLFTEGLAKTLGNQDGFNLVGQSSAIDGVRDAILATRADLVIADDSDESKRACISALVFEYPYLSFIFANLVRQSVQVVSSYLVQSDASSIKQAIESIRFCNRQHSLRR